MDEKKPADKPAEGGTEAAKPAKKLNTGKILFFAILAGAIVFNVIVATVLITVTKPKDLTEKESALDGKGPKGDEKAKKEAAGAQIHDEGEPIADPVEAIVNVAGTNGDRFLKVVLLLCYDAVKYPKMLGGGGGEGKGGALGPKKALLKDMLIEILSQMTIEELSTPESKEKIRSDFLRKANSTLTPGTGEFSGVLIDQFIVQ